MRAANVAVVAAVGGIAFALARWTTPDVPAPAPVEERVRTVTKPEIVYVDRAAPAPAAREPVAAASAEPTPEHRTAVANIERAVRTALASRRWREEDRALIHTQTPYLEAEELLEQMRPLVVAVNRRQVEVELVGSLY